MSANDLRPYSEYRDSGVPWLGTVPAHWDVRRLKTLTTIVDKRSVTGDEVLLSMRKNHGLVPYHEHFSKPPQAATLVGFKIVEPGYVVLNRMQAGFGLIFASKYHGLVSPDFGVFQLKGEVHPRYLEELCRSHEVRAEFHRESKGLGTGQSGFMRLYDDRFGTIHIAFPPNLDEQEAILKFINSISVKANRLIRNRRRLIEVLNEQKQAIITQAVTHGLDPAIPLKPSGIQWLTGIPQHWDEKPLCAIAHSKSVRNCADRELLSVYLHRGVIKFADVDEKRTNPTSDDLTNYQAVDPGDLVLNNQQAWRGSVGVSTLRGIVSPAYLVLSLSEDINPRYADYLFRSRPMVAQYLVASKGVGSIQRNLYFPYLKRAAVPCPPIAEQISIANHLDRTLVDLSRACAGAEREIELIREYRTRLVADVVTGKLDVRHLAPMLDSFEEEDVATIDAEEMLDNELEGAEKDDFAEEALNADD